MDIKIRRKNKIIDSVIFNYGIEYLKFRFEEFYHKYDHFIILETNLDNFGNIKDSEFLKHKDEFEKWSDKIIHTIVDVSLEEFSTENVKLEQSKELFKIYNDLELKFDDVILISRENEFPVIDDMSVIQDLLSYGPISLSLLDFIWTTDFVKETRYNNTLCLLYSHIIVKQKEIVKLYLKMGSEKMLLPEFLSGYRFEFFCSEEDALKQILKEHKIENEEVIKEKISESRSEVLSLEITEKSSSKPLKKYSGELPKNINLLNSQKIGRNYSKKYCVVVGVDSTHNIKSEFDNIIVVLPTENIWSDDLIEVDDNIKVHYVIVPNKPFYNVLIDENNILNFQKMFFYNEIKKILYHYNPQSIDEFHFYVGGKIIIESWEHIEKSFIYDLIG